MPEEAPMISVIIPTLDEAANLPRLLETLARESTPHETIVVDGGSRDGTLALARGGADRVVESAPGRGRQLTAGASLARGETLLFLHADCELPAGGLAAIAAALASRPDLVGGNFRLIFPGARPFYRWLTGFYAWIRRHGLYYGDSGIFVRTAVYRRLGGIRPLALMEDYDFTRRLEAAGPTCCLAEPALVTSARRFEGRAALAIFFGWVKIHALYHLGVGSERLARLYDSDRRSAGRRSSLKGPPVPR